MKPEEVQKLAALARIKIDDAELPKFTKEFEAIVQYVGHLESLKLQATSYKLSAGLKNVMREDEEPHETGKYTEALASQFPAREGNALSVKQIITHD